MNRPGHKGWAVAACGGVVVLSAAALLLRAPASAGAIRHVLLISIDTCRADHLSCYGWFQPVTPHLDAVAAEGVRWARAVSPVPMTLPAHASLLTGTTPLVHGVHNNFDYRLGSSVSTLAELLKGAGFRTGAVIGAFVLDRQFGLDRGFEEYDDRLDSSRRAGDVNERLGEDVAGRGIAWLKAHASEKTFLFLHFYDPHAPYEPPADFAGRFGGDRYAAEIAYTDQCIGQVLGALRDLGLDGSSLVVIVGDHGEMLNEHGESTHAYFVYQSALHVPLIVRPPGPPQPAVVTTPVGLIDVLPTVCGYLGIPVPPQVEGRDLRRLVPGDAERAFYCESITPTRYGANALRGLVTQRWKYIQSRRPELYDLPADPRETRDLAAQEPEVVEALDAQLEQLIGQRRAFADAEEPPPAALSQADIQRLEALGYVASARPEDAWGIDAEADDPKDLIAFHEQDSMVISFIALKEYARAADLCRRMLAERPKYWRGHLHLARIAAEEDRLSDAVDEFRRALELNPGCASARVLLGKALAARGEHAAAVDEFTRALADDPTAVEGHRQLADTLARLGRTEEAVGHYRQALALHSGDAETQLNLGIALATLCRFDEAIGHYREAIELAPDNVKARSNLGKALQLVGRHAEAIPLYREALRRAPESAPLWCALADAAEQTGDLAGAVASYREAVRLDPQSLVGLNGAAWILATHPDAAARQPAEAVQLARRAVEAGGAENASVLDTLAAAYAAAGDFPQAVSTARKALALARAGSAPEMAADIAARLTLFEKGRSYGQPEGK